MPRRAGVSRSSAGPSRPLRTPVSRPAPAPAPQMTRPAAPAPAPAHAPAPASHVPAPAPAAAVAAPAAAAPKAPSMMAQIATTAAGVAAGSVIGSVVTNAIMGGGNKEAAPAPAPAAVAAPAQYEQPQQNNGPNPCSNELQQFIQCAQNQSDLGLCSGFNVALKECRITHGLPAGPN